jgi:hypothetical protein
MIHKRKRTAIIAAVAHYIQTAEAAMPQSPDFQVAEPEANAPAAKELNVWGISGRQQQMQMRVMMQMKAFHGSRPKF